MQQNDVLSGSLYRCWAWPAGPPFADDYPHPILSSQGASNNKLPHNRSTVHMHIIANVCLLYWPSVYTSSNSFTSVLVSRQMPWNQLTMVCSVLDHVFVCLGVCVCCKKPLIDRIHRAKSAANSDISPCLACLMWSYYRHMWLLLHWLKSVKYITGCFGVLKVC